ncbi:MAG TPA: hypothetical protein DCS87_04900 [Rheinheimera sp.]|nr:hypothetical protein [Rheinheimera sp.]
MPAFSAWVEQRVLLTVVRGPWSDRTAMDYCDAFKTAAKPLLGADWAHIVYLDDWELGSPDIEPIIRGLATWAVSNRLRYFAQVYSPNMVKQYQLNRMLVSDLGTCEKRTFALEADAFAWLTEVGFGTDSALPMVKRA